MNANGHFLCLVSNKRLGCSSEQRIIQKIARILTYDILIRQKPNYQVPCGAYSRLASLKTSHHWAHKIIEALQSDPLVGRFDHLLRKLGLKLYLEP